MDEHRMRTCLAVALGNQTLEGGGEARVESVSTAFNSPFWPFVLVPNIERPYHMRALDRRRQVCSPLADLRGRRGPGGHDLRRFSGRAVHMRGTLNHRAHA